MTADDIIDNVGVRLLGVVRDDPAVQISANGETPFLLGAAGGAARCFMNIARRLNGEEVPLSIR